MQKKQLENKLLSLMNRLRCEMPIALMRAFPKAIVPTTKPRFDVEKTYASVLDLVVKTTAPGKTRISAIPVLFPNVSLEIAKFHLSQILGKCSLLFTLADIYKCVEIWRAEYAQQILLIISEVFGDVDPKERDFELVIENNQAEETIYSDWEDVRDDSTINISLHG